ncbi:hypothetical protein LJC07_08345 [Christensenellaceae bacterium OttesenSCG-928-L17]|nr:hypothetical protein [Christensenellaceae bacterium OttesenSCG-928-L17]
MWFGSEQLKPAADAAKAAVRSVENFNWTFIALLAFVVYVYASEFEKKNYKGIAAGLSLYMVHWFYEIMNAVIGGVSGYALWTVSPESTSFILLIGVSWELSMMFSIAGLATSKLLPDDPKKKIFGINNRWLFAILNAALFSAIEIFLATTPAFIWVYPWWGTLPVFITTYIPFFLAAFLVPDCKPRTQKLFIGGLFAVNVLLMAILIPLGII